MAKATSAMLANCYQIKGSLLNDTVSLGRFTSPAQSIIDLKKIVSRGYWGHDGLLGLGSLRQTKETPNFIDNLCDEGKLEECGFGVAFGKNGTGKLVLGRHEKNFHK